MRLRHLPVFAVPVLIEIRPKRDRCPYGTGPPTTPQRCLWYAPRSPNTTAYEPWALRRLLNATGADAARNLGGSEETIDGLLDRWIERTVDWTPWERLGVLGLDEIALTRGHRDVVTLVTVPLAGGGVALLAALADRQTETVAAFLRAIPEPRRRTIERACTAMYAGFVRAIAAEGPWAEVVIDRFHGARAYRHGAAMVRQQELKRRKRVRPQAAYAESTGAMGSLRKRSAERKPSAWELRERMFTDAPTMETAYHLRENLTELFERDSIQAGAKCAMRAWCKRVRASGRAECASVLGTIERWIDAITNYFQGRQTRGVWRASTPA